jgi:hypothetical protein
MNAARSTIAAAAAAALIAPSASLGQVSIRPPHGRLSCASGIRLGVRYDKSTGPSSRRVTVTVIRGSKTIYHRRLMATSSWTYWVIHPPCGQTYVVRYATATGIFQGPVDLSR